MSAPRQWPVDRALPNSAVRAIISSGPAGEASIGAARRNDRARSIVAASRRPRAEAQLPLL